MATKKKSTSSRASSSKTRQPKKRSRKVEATATEVESPALGPDEVPPAEPPLPESSADRVFNCRRSVERPGDLLLDPQTLAGDMPAEIDYRAAWWKIGNQLKSGSCVGWAVGEGLVRWYLTTKGLLAKESSLSVRYFWMAAKEMDEFVMFPSTFLEDAGTSIRSALDIARQFGCVTEHLLPFQGGLYQESSDLFYALASQLKLGGSLQSVNKDVDQLKRWLVRQGPVAARLLVDQTFLQANAAAPNLDDYVPLPNTHRLGHAVVLVGYRTDGRFIVRNSYGTNWGDKGFAYASASYVMQGFTEFYGVYR